MKLNVLSEDEDCSSNSFISIERNETEIPHGQLAQDVKSNDSSKEEGFRHSFIDIERNETEISLEKLAQDVKSNDSSKDGNCSINSFIDVERGLNETGKPCKPESLWSEYGVNEKVSQRCLTHKTSSVQLTRRRRSAFSSLSHGRNSRSFENHSGISSSGQKRSGRRFSVTKFLKHHKKEELHHGVSNLSMSDFGSAHRVNMKEVVRDKIYSEGSFVMQSNKVKLKTILSCIRSDYLDISLRRYINMIFHMTMTTFFITNLAIFITGIIIFACLIYFYILVFPQCVNPHGAHFSSAFALSWSTFTTVGYGHISPVCWFGNTLTLVEAFFGIIFSSFIGATFFAKVIRIQSQADVEFTDSMIVQYNQGINKTHLPERHCSYTCPVLQFRIANKRYGQHGGEIINATLNCVAITTTKTGVNHSSLFSSVDDYSEISYSFSKLDIDTPSHPFFRRVWNVQHVLNEHSPLLSKQIRCLIKNNNGYWPNHLKNQKDVSESIVFEQVVVNISGTGSISNSTVHSQKIYDRSDLVVGYEYVDIIYRDERSHRLMMDLSMINNVTEQFGGGGEPLDVQA